MVFDRLYMKYTTLDDAAYYHVTVHNTTSNIQESTELWLRVLGINEWNIFVVSEYVNGGHVQAWANASSINPSIQS